MPALVRPRVLLATAAALAAVLPLVPASAEDPPRLRVLTYNIHHGEGTDKVFDLPRIARIIREARPDLVALQEVDRKTRRASGVDQAAELGRLTGLHATFGKAMDYSDGEYGNTILSKVPPERVTVHPLPYEPGTEPRAVVAVHLRPADGLPEMIFASTHLCHLREANRVAQAKQINRVLLASGGPTALLAGDLNARAGSETLAEFGTQWIDTLAGIRTIDYVLTRKGDPWQVVEATIIDDRIASDHRPVLVVLEWRGSRPSPGSPD